MNLIVFILLAQLRVVSLAPSISEILFRLGADNLVVGVTTYCSYPQEKCAEKEKVGGVIDPSLERIVYLSPDLVIGFRGLTPPWVLSFLKENGIKVIEVRTLTLSDLKNDVILIGRELGFSERAKKLVEELKTIPECSSHIPWRVVVFANLLPPVVAGKRAFVNEILKRAGLKNAFDDVDADYFVVSQEEIVLRAPDFAFLTGGDKEGFEMWGIKIYSVDENLFSVPSLRIRNAVEELCDKIEQWNRGSL